MSEVDEAVRRIRECKAAGTDYPTWAKTCEAYGTSDGHELAEMLWADKSTIVAAYLAEHLPDDDELIDSEFVRRLPVPACFTCFDSRGWKVEFPLLGYGVIEFRTKGEVRRLLRGFKIEVKP